MRTLFLSSGGVRFPIIRREFLKILPKSSQEIKLAHITTAANVVNDTNYLEEDKKVFQELEVQVEEIDITGKSELELRKQLTGKDVIYVQGGNGFYLLRQIKDTGFDKVIKELIDRGVIYFGVSAGTYVACPTIEMHEWKSIKDDHFGLTDFSAMNLVPFLITVHFNREKYQDKIKEGASKTSLPVKVLTDDQAILVKGDKITLVGEGDEIKL